MLNKPTRARLYLFTDEYPFGKGEKPFVEPEIEALKKIYNVVVVSHASERAIADEANRSALPRDVDLVCINSPSKFKKIWRAVLFPFSKLGRKEIKHLIQDGLSIGRLRDTIGQFATSSCLARMYSRQGIFDYIDHAVYYTFWLDRMSLAIALVKEKNPSLRFVSRVHGYDLYNERNANGRQPFQRAIRDLLDRLFFLSDSAIEYFKRNFGKEIKADQYAVNALGVNLRGEQPSEIDNSVFRVVSCSNVIPLKRVELICEGLAATNCENIEWVHFGDGEALDKIKHLAKDRNVNLITYGHVSNETVIDFYKTTYVNAFITTSSTEGSPVSIQEALSFGIPIIGTDVGAIAEQIEGNGILLPANPCIKEVATAIRELYNAASGEIAEMRRKSKRIWAEKFDAERNKKDFIENLLFISR